MSDPVPDHPPLPYVPVAESHCRGDEGVIATVCVSNPMERASE